MLMTARQKILIVDDREENLYALKMLLRETGAEVVEASSGNEALIASLNHDFNLAILDVQMPGMDGYELAQYLRGEEKTKNIPIIFLSAVYSDAGHVFKGYESGAVDFIVKPYNPGVFLSKVNVLLQREQLLLELKREMAMRVQTEQAIKDREEELTAIYENAPLVIMLVDAERRLRKVNKFAEAFACPSASGLLGRRTGEALGCLHSLDDPRGCGFGSFCQQCAVRAAIAATIESGRSSQQMEANLLLVREGNLQGVTGIVSTVRVNVREEPLALVTIQDITERKRVEEILREREEQLALFVEHAPAAVAMFDKELRCILASRRWLTDYNIGDRDIIGLRLDEVLPFMPPQWKAAYRRCLEGAVERAEEDPFRRADGCIDWVRWEMRPWYRSNREIGGIIILTETVTERKEARKELERHAAQLEAANKELESFSYSVSHDLRTPLRAIDGYSRMILRKQEGHLDSETARQFGQIRENVQMMGQLIEDLLAFSRLGRANLSTATLAMDALVREVWQELQVVYPERRMTLKMNGLSPGLGDWTLIRQVISNLLSNAIKFTRGRDESVIEVGECARGEEQAYFVRDNGCGFDMKYYGKLFGVFQRLHSAEEYEGTGVGLAIVQRIIHRHGGRVWAEGEEGQGACFYFTLPRGQMLSKLDNPGLSC